MKYGIIQLTPSSVPIIIATTNTPSYLLPQREGKGWFYKGAFSKKLPLWQKVRGAKKPLDESEREERKSWLKAQHSEYEDHGIRSHHFMGNRWGNSGNSVRLYFGGAPKSLQMVIAAMKLKDSYFLEEKL